MAVGALSCLSTDSSPTEEGALSYWCYAATAGLALVLSGSLAGISRASDGDWWYQVYPAYEIADSSTIDIHDGTLNDWASVAPGPSVPCSAFVAFEGDAGWLTDYHDPADLNLEVWLGWLRTPPRVYVGVSRSDDVYIAGTAPGSDELVNAHLCDGLYFQIDGDKSGGAYLFGSTSDPRTCQHAQHYAVILDRSDEMHLCMGPGEWADDLPYADGGGRALRNGTTEVTMEFYVTPFDRRLRDDEHSSVASRLEPGGVVGFAMTAYDPDVEGAKSDTTFVLGQLAFYLWPDASWFMDMVLLPAIPSDTGVQRGSWGIVKGGVGALAR